MFYVLVFNFIYFTFQSLKIEMREKALAKLERGRESGRSTIFFCTKKIDLIITRVFLSFHFTGKVY
jgi:hypothetical protein